MKKTVFVLFLCISGFTSGFSQTKQESIRELFHIMRNDSVTKKVFESIMPAFTSKSENMDPTQRAKQNEKIAIMMEKIKVLKSKLDEELVLMYDKYFSQQEISDLIAFFKSPSGQKYVKVRPEITKEMIMKVMQKYLPEMQKGNKDKVDE